MMPKRASSTTIGMRMSSSTGVNTMMGPSQTDDSFGDENSDMDNNENFKRRASTAAASPADRLANKESQRVFKLRLLVLTALILVTVTVTLILWFTTTRAEEEDFHTNFKGAATKLIESFEEIVAQKLNAIGGFGVSLTSYAMDQKRQQQQQQHQGERSTTTTFTTTFDDHNNTYTNATTPQRPAPAEEVWPFVTAPNFQPLAQTARSLSDALFLNVVPIVQPDQKDQWNQYAQDNKWWIAQGAKYQNEVGLDLIKMIIDIEGDNLKFDGTGSHDFDMAAAEPNLPFPAMTFTDSAADEIWFYHEDPWYAAKDPGIDTMFPMWQSSPLIVPPSGEMTVNFNMAHLPWYASHLKQAVQTSQTTIGGMLMAPPGNVTTDHLNTAFFSFILSYAAGELVPYLGDPFSSVFVPIFDSFGQDKKTVGAIYTVIQWASYFKDVLPASSPPVRVVLENSCEGPFTFLVSEETVQPVGQGDFHDDKYTHLGRKGDFDNLSKKLKTGSIPLNEEICKYTMTVYPTEEFENTYTSSMPAIITLAVGVAFLAAFLLFWVYNRMVDQRQTLVMDTAENTTAIVSSLFPAQIKDRLMNEYKTSNHGTGSSNNFSSSGALKLTTHTPGGGGTPIEKPLADLFLETTLVFADVSGFSGWSSVREPSQVFRLLETLYMAFDEIAERRRVFKVETVGDCYVAVAGLPEPRADHAVAIARFSHEIISTMHILVKELEVTLGPDTGELSLRVGIHSGPVTAGVLRGRGARFQLFGAEVNKASRIETTGLPGRIHCSSETAELLRKAGKESWLEKRKERIDVMGLGIMESYWVQLPVDHSARRLKKPTRPELVVLPGFDPKTSRLIQWNVEVLVSLLRAVVAQRDGPPPKFTGVESSHFDVHNSEAVDTDMPLDELKEIIALPEFDRESAGCGRDPDTVIIPRKVCMELTHLVSAIAGMYNDNPFHSFDHASHVLMSVTKTISRIIAPSTVDSFDLKNLHDHTYGITSDPLTHFAVAFSALIHDVDHAGVANAQLVKEGQPMAARYNNKSVAEQNSFNLGWGVLMEPGHANLRRLLFPTQSDQNRFRQLVVNAVMATDIVDQEMLNLRNNRWDKAFSMDSSQGQAMEQNERDRINRKATIVIEHIIQASDVSHTMQHWHVYRKWNTKLFEEMYLAYLNGRMEKNPADFWYEGELGFFDFYIIPLTRKLKECGVFGVSSGEFLNYALNNRAEWMEKGKFVTAELADLVQKKYGEKQIPPAT